MAHLVPGYHASRTSSAVDGDAVPVPHFGAALGVAQFKELAERVKAAGVEFVIEPHIRFQGEWAGAAGSARSSCSLIL